MLSPAAAQQDGLNPKPEGLGPSLGPAAGAQLLSN